MRIWAVHRYQLAYSNNVTIEDYTISERNAGLRRVIYLTLVHMIKTLDFGFLLEEVLAGWGYFLNLETSKLQELAVMLLRAVLAKAIEMVFKLPLNLSGLRLRARLTAGFLLGEREETFSSSCTGGGVAPLIQVRVLPALLKLVDLVVKLLLGRRPQTFTFPVTLLLEHSTELVNTDIHSIAPSRLSQGILGLLNVVREGSSHVVGQADQQWNESNETHDDFGYRMSGKGVEETQTGPTSPLIYVFSGMAFSV